ncbi:cysteine-rich small domain-containing protein [Pseudobutyrivibrio sp. YE44]|uniref:cysteine-rich small domain-containing protein n=1 Tax=Pseudobutyrivibrio sp. YE44 TaxID=1520802 RepID=UPI000B8519D1
MEHYKFFQNKECEYFPCHKVDKPEDFNCLFCYCPLYCLGDKCGGNFEYTKSGVKSCVSCSRPHLRGNYDEIIRTLKESGVGKKTNE